MTDPFNLGGKTIVILGGAGLLGSEFARACAAHEATVIIADLDEKRGRALAKKVRAEGRKVCFIKVNIANETALRGLASRVRKRSGKIDGLVHAAYPRTKNYGVPLEKAKGSEILKNIDLQLGAPLLSTRAFMPLLKKGSSLVFLSSMYGVAAPRFDVYAGTSMTVPAEYAAVKGGILSLTRYFAALLGKRGVRVNAVSPGGIEAGQPASFKRAYAKKLLLGRTLLSPEDVSGAIIFLLSDASRRVTGGNLIVDGGWTL